MRVMIGWAAAALVACSGGGAPTPSGPTLEQLTAAQGQVHGFQPWDAAEATLVTALGEPTSKTDEAWTWVGNDGTKCHTLSVTRMVTTVGSVTLEETPCP